MLETYGAYPVAKSLLPAQVAPRSSEDAEADAVDGVDSQSAAADAATIMNEKGSWLQSYPKSDYAHCPCPLAPEDFSLQLQELGLELEYLRSLGPWALEAAWRRWPQRETVSGALALIEQQQKLAAAEAVAASTGCVKGLSGDSALNWTELGAPLVSLLWRIVCLKRESMPEG